MIVTRYKDLSRHSPELVTLLDLLSVLDRDITGRHLCHPNPDEAHQPNLRVIRLDEDQCPRCNGRDVLLACTFTMRVGGLVGGEVGEERLGEVCPFYDVCFLDRPIDWGVPSMVGEGGEEGLVDGPSDELLGVVVKCEHVEYGVRLQRGRGNDVSDSDDENDHRLLTCPLTQNLSLAWT